MRRSSLHKLSFLFTTGTLALALACSSGGSKGDGEGGQGGDGGGGEGGDGGGDSGGSGGSKAGGKGGGAAGGQGGSGGAGNGSGGSGGNSGGTGGGSAGSSGAGGTASGGAGGMASGGTAGGGAGGSGVRVPPTQFLEVRGSDLKDPKAVILTIDDGPDGGGNTEKMLNILKTEGVKATFCINIKNAWDVAAVPAAQALVKRMVDEGHELCNHAYNHTNLTDPIKPKPGEPAPTEAMKEAAVTEEMASLERTVNTFLPQVVPLTLNRAPFMAVNAMVQKVLTKFGVHVQVDISSQDFACGNATCVINNVMNPINSGSSGFILLHGYSGASVEALPEIIKQIRAKGMTFKKTEDVVRAKYGKTSAQLYGLP